MVGILGAGKTGRGFLARLLWESKQKFSFFDCSKPLIEGLQHGYTISFFSGKRPSVSLEGYQALHTDDPCCGEAVSGISLLLVSVGGGNLEAVGQWLAKQAEHPQFGRTGHLNVILCENARDPSKAMERAFLEALPPDMRAGLSGMVSFADAAVFCTTVQEGDCGIASEDYPSLPFDMSGIVGELPPVTGFKPVEQFENILMRKIYTYNSASGVIAYLGWWKGYENYADAANDPEILALLDRHYQAVGAAVCTEYGYEEADQRDFAALSKAKFRDPSIVDTILRNAREPQRKLAAGERIAGPAMLIQKHGGDASVLALTAAAALLYDQPEDEAWLAMKRERPVEQLFMELSGLDARNAFSQEVFAEVKKLKTVGRGRWP